MYMKCDLGLFYYNDLCQIPLCYLERSYSRHFPTGSQELTFMMSLQPCQPLSHSPAPFLDTHPTLTAVLECSFSLPTPPLPACWRHLSFLPLLPTHLASLQRKSSSSSFRDFRILRKQGIDIPLTPQAHTRPDTPEVNQTENPVRPPRIMCIATCYKGNTI